MSQDLMNAIPPMTWIEDEGRSLEPGRLMSSDRKRSLPLAGLEISSRVLDSACDSEMIQRFSNPYEEPIEAVYIFPLPGAAAIHGFELRVGERVVSGKLQERGAARAAYSQALEQGHRAALMEQERDDVFTLQVGNLPPGESVEIKIAFCQQLDYREEGLYELRLPMVLAPRYIPGQIKESSETGLGVESDTDLVPDASRISPPRLAPGFDPKVDLSLSVELLLAPGDSLSQISASQHLTTTSLSGDRVKIELARDGERLNRDFVLRWRSQTGLRSRLAYVDADQGYGLLQLAAPASAALLETGRDVVFLLDRSGSMDGFKMASAAQACALLLNSLGPRDRFAVLAFDDQMEWLTPEAVWHNAHEAGRERGDRYLRGVEARGGTELHEAIQQALRKVESRGESANSPVLVILTDGQVGDESRILKAIQKDLGEASVYTIGIDTAVNDSFLTRLARLGGGTSISVSPGEKLAAALKQIAGEIGFPALWDLETGLPDAAPDPLPDLYRGRSLSVFFRGPLPAEPTLRAQGAEGPLRMQLKAERPDFPALPRLWAKARIQALEDRYRLVDQSQRQQIKDDIIAISLEHRILCRFTAWLAVDEAERIQNADQRTQVVQPVEMPQGWAMAAGAAMPMAMAPPPPPVMAAPIMQAALPMPAAAMPPQAPTPRRQMSPPGGAIGGKAKKAAPLRDEAEELLAMPAPEGAYFEAADLDDSFGTQTGGYGGTGSLRQEQAPAAKAQGLGGMVEKLKQWVSPAPKQAEVQAASPAQAKAEGTGGQTTQKLNTAAAGFLAALQRALDALSKGESVDTQALASQREALLELLAESESAERLPALQRLLRQESMRLIKALQAGSNSGLDPLIERCRAQLTLAQSESPHSGPFWDQSI